MHKILTLVGVLGVATLVACGDRPDFTLGLGLVGKVLRTYINGQPDDLLLGTGVHLLKTSSENDVEGRANSDDGTLLGSVEKYMDSHEIRIKLPELMPDGERVSRAIKDAFTAINENGEGRGKKGGGAGAGLAILGLMMGKMMAALGLGGVGLLAMKALMVSAMALMLSIIIGVKKLASSGHDEGGHHVIHATGHGGGHDRRKREAGEIAYRGWDYGYDYVR